MIVLDLVKQLEKHKRETLVGKEYQLAVQTVNNSMPPRVKIRYCAMDYDLLKKQKYVNM